jgi:hypothetical protein
MFTGWFIIYLPVLIILGALFFVSSLDWFSFINCLLICNCVYVLLCLYVYVYVLCYTTFVFQGLHVVLFINKVTCPIYITTLTFGSRNNDKICINISTVNNCLKGNVFLIIYVFLCIMVKKRYNVYTFVKIR